MSDAILPIVLSKCGRLPDHTFASFEEFGQFLTEELQLWEWAAGHNIVSIIYNNEAAVPTTLHVTLKHIIENLRTATTSMEKGNNNNADSIKHHAVQQLSQAYSSDMAFHSREPAGKVLSAMRAHGSAAVAGAWACLAGKRLRHDHPYTSLAVLGWSEASHHRLGIGNAAKNSRQQFERLMSHAEAEWRQFSDRAKADRDLIADLVSSTTTANQSAATETDSIKQRCETIQADTAAAADAIRDDCRVKLEITQKEFHDKLEAIAKMYSQKLSLKAPVEYWDNRRKICRNWACIGAGSCILFAIVLVGYLINQLDAAAALDAGVIANGASVSAWSPAHAWNLGKILVITTVGLWIMKLLVRYTLSQIHLALDAGFRVVLTNSFLALIGEKHIEGSEARELVLKALFRPASTGMIRDDAMPPTPTAEIVQRIAGEK